MINVFLSDSDQDFINQVADELNQNSEICVNGVTSNPMDTLRSVERYNPDIVILDHMNSTENGLSLVQDIPKYSQAKIIVISNIECDDFVVKLTESGVAYYMIKPFAIDDLVKRIFFVNKYYNELFNYIFIPKQQEIQQTIISHLNKIGIPSHYKGHRYLIDAVTLVNQDNSWLNGITKRLYPTIARKNHTLPNLVERAIRYAIDRAWSTGKISDLEELFPYTIDPNKGKPTNSAFIAKMADIINLDLSER